MIGSNALRKGSTSRHRLASLPTSAHDAGHLIYIWHYQNTVFALRVINIPLWFLRRFFKGELASPYIRLFVEERHFYCERWNEQEEEHLSIDKGDGICLLRYGRSCAVLLEAISLSVILLN